MKISTIFRVAGWVVFGLLIAVVFGLALGLIVQMLWNWLMPALFGLKLITYWQAVGLFILCHLLFKSHVGHGKPHEKKDCANNRHSRIAQKIKEKLGLSDSAPAQQSAEAGSDNAGIK
jgi:hypothetical protein